MSKSAPKSYDLPMTRVLLAEDDTAIADPLARALRREGYAVQMRGDGPTALEHALSGAVDNGEGRRLVGPAICGSSPACARFGVRRGAQAG